MQAQPTSHQHRMVVAKMPIQHEIRQRKIRANTGEELLDHRTDTGMFRIEGRIGFGPETTPLWTTGFSFDWGVSRVRWLCGGT